MHARSQVQFNAQWLMFYSNGVMVNPCQTVSLFGTICQFGESAATCGIELHGKFPAVNHYALVVGYGTVNASGYDYIDAFGKTNHVAGPATGTIDYWLVCTPRGSSRLFTFNRRAGFTNTTQMQIYACSGSKQLGPNVGREWSLPLRTRLGLLEQRLKPQLRGPDAQ